MRLTIEVEFTGSSVTSSQLEAVVTDVGNQALTYVRRHGMSAGRSVNLTNFLEKEVGVVKNVAMSMFNQLTLF